MELLLDKTEGALDHDETWHAPSEIRQVVARMVDGDRVQLGTAPTRESAVALARRVIAELENPSGDWPVVGDRMLRPDAIVSIDVMRPSSFPGAAAG
ncbi:MAG: hypothetical protein FJW96_06405 [Actinobacteria bacterium]|nr:hypothetical protein [Actinomycetota bacterium]